MEWITWAATAFFQEVTRNWLVLGVMMFTAITSYRGFALLRGEKDAAKARKWSLVVGDRIGDSKWRYATIRYEDPLGAPIELQSISVRKPRGAYIAKGEVAYNQIGGAVRVPPKAEGVTTLPMGTVLGSDGQFSTAACGRRAYSQVELSVLLPPDASRIELLLHIEEISDRRSSKTITIVSNDLRILT